MPIRIKDTLYETINHGDLLDMPDVGGTVSDHDTRYDLRYLKLDGSNDPITGNISIVPNPTSTTALVVGTTAKGMTVDTTNGRMGINKAPNYPFDVDYTAASLAIGTNLVATAYTVIRTGTYSTSTSPGQIIASFGSLVDQINYSYTASSTKNFNVNCLESFTNSSPTFAAGTGTINYTNRGTYGSSTLLPVSATGTVNIFNYGGYFEAIGNTVGTYTSIGGYFSASGGDNNYDIVLNGSGNIMTDLSTGKLTLGGINNTNNENLVLDFETTSNSVIFSSTTGVTQLDFSALNLSTTGTLGAGAITGTTLKADMALTTDANLVGWWRMDDITGTTLTDYMGVNNGTINGNPVQGNGHIGKGLTFDGTGDYVALTTTGIPTGNSARTLSIWMKTGDPTIKYAFGNYGSPGNGNWFMLNWENNTVSLTFGGYRVSSPVGALKPNTWYNAVAVVPVGATMTSHVQIWINGVQQSLTVLAGSDQTLNTVLTEFGIGGVPSFTTAMFNGTLDDAMVFSRALTSAEIMQLFQMGNLDSSTSINKLYAKEGISGKVGTFGHLVADSASIGNIGKLVTLGTSGISAASRQALEFGHDGYAGPLGVTVKSNGDKIVFWDLMSSPWKGAIGVNSYDLWFQSSGHASSKISFHTLATTGTPYEMVKIDVNGMTVNGDLDLGSSSVYSDGYVGGYDTSIEGYSGYFYELYTDYLTYSYSDPEIEGWTPTTRDKVKAFAGKVFAYDQGVITYFNKDTRCFEIFEPSTGKFYLDKDLKKMTVLETVTPIVNSDVKLEYAHDSLTGEIKQVKKPTYANIYKIPEDKVVNKDTGEIIDKPTIASSAESTK